MADICTMCGLNRLKGFQSKFEFHSLHHLKSLVSYVFQLHSKLLGPNFVEAVIYIQLKR